jgi:hypothetical protein
MPLTPETFSRFGGLRLDIPVGQVGADEAIDFLDVDWGAGFGDLGPRMGASKWSKKASVYNQLFRAAAGVFLSRRENKIVALQNGEETATTSVAGTSGDVGPHLSFARLGTPAASYTYVGGQFGEGVKRWDGEAFSAPKCSVDGAAGKEMPNASGLAAWSDGGNRLVVAGATGATGPGGATSSSSHVWFSEPGAAESYESTAYVQLSPGDGENILDACEWNGQIFVFKKSRFFVFYGVSTDAEGKPIFNYRTVEIPGNESLSHKYYSGSMCVPAADGVYFLTDHGIYLTNGGTAVPASTTLEGLRESVRYEGPALTTFEGEGRLLSLMNATSIERLGERLFIPLYELSPVEAKAPEPAISRTLVYDIPREAWLVWSGKVRGMVVMTQEGGEEPHLYFSAFGGGIYRYDPGETADAHVTMAPRWQSGFYNLGSEDEKALTQAKLWGSGEVNVATAKDFEQVGKDKTFTLGVAPEVKSAQRQRTQNGVLHSHRFSGEGPWKVSRFTRYLQEDRVPDAQTK